MQCGSSAHGCCCTPIFAGALGASVAILALLPMAWIPFWVNPLHFVAAVTVFIALAVAEVADAFVQFRILNRPGSPSHSQQEGHAPMAGDVPLCPSFPGAIHKTDD